MCPFPFFPLILFPWKTNLHYFLKAAFIFQSLSPFFDLCFAPPAVFFPDQHLLVVTLPWISNWSFVPVTTGQGQEEVFPARPLLSFQLIPLPLHLTSPPTLLLVSLSLFCRPSNTFLLPWGATPVQIKPVLRVSSWEKREEREEKKRTKY